MISDPPSIVALKPAVARLPAEVIAQPVKAARPDSKLSNLMPLLAELDQVPVVDGKRNLLGVVSDQEVMLFPDRQVKEVIRSCAGTIVTGMTVTDAETRFREIGLSLLPVVDKNGRYTGRCVNRDLLEKLRQGRLRPARVGGLATPLGVYLTSGGHHAGAGIRGLIATGILFGVLLHILDWAGLVLYSALVTLLPGLLSLGEVHIFILQTGLVMMTMLLMLRLSPLSGLHAAEHMTIYAIERDLPLSETTVNVQPRSHPRCGTNLMVLLAGIQLGIVSALGLWDQVSPVGLLLLMVFWAWLVSRFWQPAGLWLQRHFTTRKPRQRELRSGIAAGQELLAKFAAEPHPLPGIRQRILASGLPVMLISFGLTSALVGWLVENLGR